VHNRLAGGIFGGDAGAVQSWCERYRRMLMVYHTRDWFLGVEQTVMISTCMETPALCQRFDPDPLVQGDPWFSLFVSITDVDAAARPLMAARPIFRAVSDSLSRQGTKGSVEQVPDGTNTL
jgi:hypothetical protein